MMMDSHKSAPANGQQYSSFHIVVLVNLLVLLLLPLFLIGMKPMLGLVMLRITMKIDPDDDAMLCLDTCQSPLGYHYLGGVLGSFHKYLKADNAVPAVSAILYRYYAHPSPPRRAPCSEKLSGMITYEPW